MGKKGKGAAPPTAPPETRTIFNRGEQYQAEMLTGNRAQKGNLPGGAPRWTYEVKWVGGAKTYEPATCLVGWEAEMKKVDDKYSIAALLPKVSPAAEALKAREAAAKLKAQELEARRRRLLRLKARNARMGNAMSDDEADGEVDGEVDEADETLPEDAINKELQILEAQLQMLASGGTVFAAAAAAAGNEPGGEPAANQGVTQGNATDLPSQHKREGRSRVWKAFDRATNRCTLPHPSGESGRVCNSLPPSGTGTSGHIRHLEAEHAADWLHIKMTGEKKSSTQMIADALAAKVDVSKPPLGTNESNELDRLAARWVAKCGRPIAITEDNELREYIARILELCKARFRYDLPTDDTVRRHLQLLGAEGKGIARNFVVRCLASGIKISITGDLWSENGMGLFGIYAHGMPEFKMEKALIALIACESEVRLPCCAAARTCLPRALSLPACLPRFG